MNIDTLRYFTVAAKAGNFSRAAKDLHVSQPTLTISIKKLEETLGVTLFERSKKGVRLTNEGKTALEQIEMLTKLWDELCRSSLVKDESVRGTIRVGCHSAVAQYTLPHILPKLLNDHPLLKIQLSHDLSRKILVAVQNSEVDIGLVINPAPAEGLILAQLAEDEVTIWKKKGLKNNSVLIYDPNIFQTHAILDKLRKKKIYFDQIIESSDLNVIFSLLHSGTGHALLPKRVAFNTVDKAQIAESFPELDCFKDKLFVAYKPSLRKNPAAKVIIDALKAL